MSAAAAPSFLAGDSAMVRMLREHDWSSSPLGEPATWPQSLRSVVDLMLGSAKPFDPQALVDPISERAP